VISCPRINFYGNALIVGLGKRLFVHEVLYCSFGRKSVVVDWFGGSQHGKFSNLHVCILKVSTPTLSSFQVTRPRGYCVTRQDFSRMCARAPLQLARLRVALTLLVLLQYRSVPVIEPTVGAFL